MKSKIDKEKLPQHIAIIMDGNGRWAKKHGQPRVFGHRNGVKAVREASEGAAELGVKYLTLYAFSTENWGRPAFEVNALMGLLVETIRKEVATMNKNRIRLQAIGDLEALPSKSYKALMEGIEATKDNDRMTLVLALNYSAKWEIVQAARRLARQAADGEIRPEDISEATFDDALSTKGIPHPELMIRTSGEQRVSNFLLWQIAYAELAFLPIFWPEFNRSHLYQSILDYQRRERRFGKTSEQVIDGSE